MKTVSKQEVGTAPLDFDFAHVWLRDGEHEVLVALLRSVNLQNAPVVEIGCNNGNTSWVILRALPQIKRYIGIDTLPGYKTSLECQANERPYHPGSAVASDLRFSLIMRPRGSLDLTPKDFPEGAAAVFIDGDHGRSVVEHDSALARLITRPGGLIIWHDYDTSGETVIDVRAVLDEYYAVGRPLVHVEGTQLAFERR